MTESTGTQPERPQRTVSEEIGRFLIVLLLCVAVVFGAIKVAQWLIKTKPKPDRRPRKESVLLVETLRPAREDRRIDIPTTGTVVAAREVSLGPQVSGKVVGISDKLIPGGRFAAGETLLQIEKVDYELNLASSKAGVAQSEYQYKLELGRQAVARKEWAMLDDRDSASELEKELVLRKPHLAAAEAGLSSAQAALDKAELDLSRTTLRAPFNLTVREKFVDLGGQVSPQSIVADVVGTDEYWIVVSVPVGELRWLKLPEGDSPGSRARIVLRTGDAVLHEWAGDLIRLRPNLEAGGRLAQLIVKVEDPLTQNPECPLLIGSFVHVHLQGPTLEDVFAVPRSAVHNGDQVWLKDPEGRLDIQEVKVLFATDEEALVRDGFQEGAELVISQLAAPAPGMRLATPDEVRKPTAGKLPAEGANE